MTIQNGFLDTSFGKIAYSDTGGTGPVVFLVHGNSASRRIFTRQLESDLATRYRLVAMDLPGHGESDDAPDPANTYFFAGFASAAIETLDALEIEKAALFGWSLGGHIVLEMLARWPGATSAFILGTPPLPNDADRAMSAFLPSDTMGLTFKEDFTDEEAAAFAGMNFLDKSELTPWMIADAKRTDGRFRPIMFQGHGEGRNLDEEEIVCASDKPLAVVIGSEDTFVNQIFLNSIAYANPWGGKVLTLEGRGHAPFWEAADEFNELLARFLKETLG